MKNRRIMLLPVMALLMAIIVAGCGRKESSVDTDEDTETILWEDKMQDDGAKGDEIKDGETTEPEQAPAQELTEAQLREFTDLFNTAGYNGFLSEPFNDPSDISWDDVLLSGAGLGIRDIGEAEINAYLKEAGEKKLYGDLMAIRKTELADYVKRHTGTDIVPDEDDLSWIYVKEYDSFYRETWVEEQTAYTCISGEKAGESYTLRFHLNDDSAGIDPRSHRGVFADRVLKLTGSGDDLVMQSNAFMWEEQCDEEQTFDVELPQFDGPVRFITYREYEKEVSIVLVKDGKLLADLSTYIDADELAYLRKVISVGFFDFNADGKKDIVVIGDSDYGKHILLYMAVPAGYEFESFADIDDNTASKIGTGFTMAEVKKTLLKDGKEEFGTYREAYAQIVSIYNMMTDEYGYGLIYADADDVPELVIDHFGYGVSLYTYRNGHAKLLMDRWTYGAGGNSGYSYMPGKGIYYNGNADYAGAVYYDTYMSEREDGEIAADYWVRSLNFNDLDGDGEPSEEEFAVSDEYEGNREYHNETDKEMTEEEIKAVVEKYEGYEMKPLEGTMDYESIMRTLNGDM